MRCIDASAQGGIVRLRGSIPSYYLKQLAQETARKVPGVRRIQNELEVVYNFVRRR
jgi:osmotically-inducible protein OsmY